MDENKKQINQVITPSAVSSQDTVVLNGTAPADAPSQPAATPPVRQRNGTIRILNILYATIIVPCALVFAYSLATVSGSSDAGAGFALLTAAFWGIAATITWIILLLIFWYTHRSPKAGQSALVALQSKEKRRAYISLALSVAQFLLFATLMASIIFVGKIPDAVFGIAMLITMFAIPVLSWLLILAIIYAIQTFKTPYRKIGFWSLAVLIAAYATVGTGAVIASLQ
jgi:hypothetical protein